MTDLAIANSEGFEGDDFIRVAQADIGVKLGKLLSGSVEVDKFILNEPEINLVRAANGAVNWNFAEGGMRRKVPKPPEAIAVSAM